MKKIKLSFLTFVLSVVLVVNAICFCVPVYALDDDGYYTLEDGTVIAEDEWDYWTRVLLYYGCQLGAVGKMDYSTFMQNNAAFANWWNVNKSYWEGNENITISESQSLELLEILKEYIQQNLEEVEKINYKLIRTNTQIGGITADTYGMKIENAFTLHEGESVRVTDGYSELDRFRLIWQLQSDQEEFPGLYYVSWSGPPVDSEKVQSVGAFNQYLNLFQGYEVNRMDSTKVSCFIGDLDASSTACIFSLYTYDFELKTLTVDRWQSMLQQYSGTYAAGEWTLTTGYRSVNAGSAPAKSMRFQIEQQLDDNALFIPGLITQDGSIFRLFATEQDALRYFETCADSGLNFDPNQVYTGGSVTINNNGDVIINNNPPGGDEEPGGESSGILGVLQDIRDWVKKIYNQVVIGNVIDAVNALANVLDTLKNYLDEIAGDATAIAELGEELVTKFPFSLPRDILLVVTLFEAEPVAPVWKIPFRADFGGPTGIKVDETFTIDFTDFQDAVDVLKWFLSLVWLFGLAMLTPKVLGTGGISSKGD